MIFSKYKKFSTTHTTNNISNDKTSEKIKNNFLKESIIPTSWEIRNSIKEDEDFFGYDISRSKNK